MKTRSFSILAAAGGLFFLSGCSAPSLEGDWTGQMQCSDPTGWMENDVELPLEDVGDFEYAGHLEANGDMSNEAGDFAIRVEADVQLELTDDAGGAQPVTVLFSNYEVWVDSEYSTEDVTADDWNWDGEDELTYVDDDAGCEMTLVRGDG